MTISLRPVWRSFVTLGMVVAAPLLAAADTLSGQILDPQGRIVPDAEIRLFGRTSGDVRTSRSTADGRYAFNNLASGDYLLEAQGTGAALSGVMSVTVDGAETQDVTLAVSGLTAEVAVVASSTPLAVQEIGKAVDVIDSEEIRLRNEFSIVETLRAFPGIRVRQLRGPGSFTTIQTRGLRNQDTLVLIDGMRFRDAASPQGDATAFLAAMPTVDTEQIEFMRGSGSSLYGTSGMAGVINLVSRTGGAPPQGDILVEGGGLGLVRTLPSVRGGLADDRLSYSAALAYLDVRHGVRKEQSYRSVSPQGMLRLQATPTFSLTGRFWYTDDELALNESPAFPDEVLANFPETGTVPAVALPTDQLDAFETGRAFNAGSATFVPDQDDPDQRAASSFFNGSLLARQIVSANTTYTVGYQGLDTNRAFIDGPQGGNIFDPATENRNNNDGRIDTLQARVDSTLGAFNFLNAGYEFERETYFSDSSGNTASSDIETRSHAVYAQNQLSVIDGRLTVTVGGRLQAFDLEEPAFVGGAHPYGGTTFEAPTAYTGDAAVAYFATGSGTKLRLHVGNSFRTPSAFERFGGSFSSFSGSFNFWGDPGLRPEKSVSVDGGIDQYWFGSRLQLSATYFYTDLQETIIFDFANFPANDPFGRFGGYRNTGGGRARGLELSAQASPSSATNLRAAYTYTDSESATATIGDDFFGIPGLSDHLFTLTATHWFTDRLNATFDIVAASDYSLSPFGATGRRLIFGGPVKGDLVVRYELPTGDRVKTDLYGKIDNMFDQLYYENGFLGPGAWAIGGLRVRY